MKDNMKKIPPFKKANTLIPALLALTTCALLCMAFLASCDNILETVPRKSTGGGIRMCPRQTARRRLADLMPAR